MLLSGGDSTHPPVASPGHPLFGFAGKRGFFFYLDEKVKIVFLSPLSAVGEERANKRSDVGVSRLCYK